MNATFLCNLADQASNLPHSWEHTIGSGHATLALRADWQAQMRRSHDELGFRHVRFHGLLCDDMGTLICQNEQLLYSFFNADQIFDFLLSTGMRPFVERQLRYELATAAYGSMGALQVFNESDPQIVRAVDAMPRARELALAARRARARS